MNTTIPVEPFDATFRRMVDGKLTRLPCRVVGITQNASGTQLVILRWAADGTTWAEEVEDVVADEIPGDSSGNSIS